MADRKRSSVKKTRALQISELIDSLQLIRESIEQIQHGRSRYVMALSTQLRKLVAETRPENSLLLLLAKDFGVEPSLFCMTTFEDDNDRPAVLDEAIIEIQGFPITAQRQLASQIELTFNEIVDRPIVRVREELYKPRQVIRWFSDKIGVHSDPSLPADFDELVRFGELTNFLLQLGTATVLCGASLLRTKMELDMRFVLGVPRSGTRPERAVFVYDSKAAGNPMRMSVTLDRKLIPSLHLTSLQGREAHIHADRTIDWSTPRVVQITVGLSDELQTSIALNIDEKTVGTGNFNDVLFVQADATHFDTYWNKQYDGEPQAFSFALGPVKAFDRRLNAREQAEQFLEFDSRVRTPDLVLVSFSELSYARSERGTLNLKMEGGVAQTTKEQWMAAE